MVGFFMLCLYSHVHGREMMLLWSSSNALRAGGALFESVCFAFASVSRAARCAPSLVTDCYRLKGAARQA
jgi:hypothetical protein